MLHSGHSLSLTRGLCFVPPGCIMQARLQVHRSFQYYWNYQSLHYLTISAIIQVVNSPNPFHVFQLRSVIFSPLSPPPRPSPHPRLVDAGEAFTVRRLLGLCWWVCGLQYMVDSQGYISEERSWVSACLILDPMLIKMSLSGTSVGVCRRGGAVMTCLGPSRS